MDEKTTTNSNISCYYYDSTNNDLQEIAEKKQTKKEEKKFDSLIKELNTKSCLTQDDVVIASEKYTDMVEVKTKIKNPESEKNDAVEEHTEENNPKRRRGRPKKNETNKPHALIKDSASNPIHKHPVDHGIFDFEKNILSVKNRARRDGNENDSDESNRDDDDDDHENKTYESAIHVKDPRLWTFNDYIKYCHDAYMIDTIPLDEFRQLRRNCKASYCLPDPSQVFLGVSQRHEINFDSTMGGLDKWPYPKKMSTRISDFDRFVSTSDFNHSSTDIDNFTDIIDNENLNQVRDHFKSLFDINQDTSKHSKHDKKSQKKYKIQKYTKKKEDLMKKIVRPVYKPDSVSSTILSVTRSIIDDINTNPVYFSHENMNKFQRGLHDCRSHRLYTLFESPVGLVKNWDKYHMKIQTPKWERKSNTFQIGGYNHVLHEIGYDYMTEGVNDQSVNAGVDYVESLLCRSDDVLIPMDKNETCTTLKESLMNTKNLTRDMQIADITNEIKNFCSNFSILYSENTRIKKNGQKLIVPYFIKRKDAPLMSYSTGDLFTETHSDTSYIEPCFDYPAELIVPKIQTTKKKGKNTQTNQVPHHINQFDETKFVSREELAKNYEDFIREKVFFRNTLFLRFLTLKALKGRLFCTSCPKKIDMKRKRNSDIDNKNNDSETKSKHDEKDDKNVEIEEDDEKTPLKKKQRTTKKQTRKYKFKKRKTTKAKKRKSSKITKKLPILKEDDEDEVNESDEKEKDDKKQSDNDVELDNLNDHDSDEEEGDETKITKKSKSKINIVNTENIPNQDDEQVDYGKFDTPENIQSTRTNYQNIFPLFHFFIDNPTQNLPKLLMFNMLGNCFKNLPEIALFTKPKESKSKLNKNKTQNKEDEDLGIKKDVSTIVFGNTDESTTIDVKLDDMDVDHKTSENDDDIYYIPETSKNWTIAPEWKQLIDNYKNHNHCWYPIRKSVSYPPPKRKTSVTASVAFYASRMRTTELTFRADRQPIVSGNIVKNALTEIKMEYLKDDKTKDGKISQPNPETEIISPFVPMWKSVFKSESDIQSSTSNSSSFSSSSSSKTPLTKKKSIKYTEDEKARIIIDEYLDDSVNHVLGELLSHGPVFRAIMDSLKTGLQYLVGKRLSKDSSNNSSQTPKPETDKMVISDGINIGYMYNKSWEVLGSARLHYRNNTRLQLVTKSYRESQAIHVGENSGYRPCNRGQSCVCTKVKARQDILESKQQRSQAFTAAEFLLPNEKYEFLMYGKLPKEHGPCVMCDTMMTNLIVSFYVREGFEPNHPIQSHGVIIGNTENDYRLSDILPYTSGPKENLNGLIAPYPKYKEQDVIYVVLKLMNHEFKRIKLKQSASHFYMASITNIMESQQSERNSQPKKDQNKKKSDYYKEMKPKIPIALETINIIKKLDYQALDILTENLQTLAI